MKRREDESGEDGESRQLAGDEAETGGRGEADEVGGRDGEPLGGVTSEHERDRPPGQEVMASGSEGGGGEDESVDRAVEPEAEPGCLAACARDRSVDAVEEPGRNEHGGEPGRREHEQGRNDTRAQRGEHVRKPEPPLVVEHAEVPVDHRDNEQPPERTREREPGADTGDGDPGRESGRAERQRLPVLAATLIASRTGTRRRRGEEGDPGARPVALPAQLAEQLLCPHLAGGHGRRAMTTP